MYNTTARYRVPVSLFVFFCSFYLLTARGILSVPDEIINFLTVRSLAETGSFVIDVDCAALHEFVQIRPDGQCYGKYDPGMSITSLPWYWIGRWVSGAAPADYESFSMARLWVSTFNQFVTAATCVVLYGIAYQMTKSSKQALELAFLFGLATLAWPYATTYFAQPLVGLLLATAVFLLLKPLNKLAVIGAGMLLGWACITRLETLPLTLLVVGYAAYKTYHQTASWRQTRQQIFRLFIPVFLALLIYLWLNQIRSSYVYQSGYAGESWTNRFDLGLFGLLFSSGRGLIFYSPLILLAVPGLVLLWRQSFQAETMLITALFLIQLGTYASWWSWEGGWAWGPRFLVTTQPFLLLGLLPWLEMNRVRPFLLLLFILGFGVQIIGVTTSPLTYLLRTDYSYQETLFKPAASPLWGQLQDLLSHRVTLLVPSQAHGVLSLEQTIAWVLVCLVLLAASTLVLWRTMERRA
ncbi:MAG: hypothetical protein H6667_03425 [Ardenticatenaceae bacterium]|nr:hypothetical protein [Ardenticatenaceae bacterium]MCB9443059.1 hypothetical protein [Ardenticatenaceae bacterium]